MTTVEQPTRSRIRSVGASSRSDTPSTRKKNEHDIRAKSRRHHRSVARHRRATVESLSAHRLSSDRQFSFNAQERQSGDPGIIIEGDITRPETAERILGTAAERFGRIDTLVHNAGVFIAKPFTEYSEKDFATMIAVNLAGFFHLSQKAAASML